MPIGAGCHRLPLSLLSVVSEPPRPDQHGDAGGAPHARDAAAKPADMKSRCVSLPRNVVDKPGWANDGVTALTTQGLTVSDHNVCSVLAVAEQEATYQGGPRGAQPQQDCLKEINAGRQAAEFKEKGTALPSNPHRQELTPSASTSFCTEREMSEIFEDMIGSVPMGKQLFWQPQPGAHRRSTAGERRLAEAFNARGYPYPVKESIRHEVSTCRAASGLAPNTSSAILPTTRIPSIASPIQCGLVREAAMPSRRR